MGARASSCGRSRASTPSYQMPGPCLQWCTEKESEFTPVNVAHMH